jgi:hypothetical protein
MALIEGIRKSTAYRWANPKNWGVKDYSDKGDFNAAYGSARRAGEKEFMWNNKRFNTKSDMPPTQQQNVYGNTDIGLNAKVAPIWHPKERISQTIAPMALNNVSAGYIMKNYVKPFIKGRTNSGEVMTKESIPYMYQKDGIDPQIDMLRKYMGLEQHFNTIVPSETKPGSFDFNPEYKSKISKDLTRAYGSFDGTVQAHNLTKDPRTVFDHKLVDYNESLRTGQPYTGEATTLYPLGRHQESIDSTSQGRSINYHDVFDLNPQILNNKVTRYLGIDNILNDLNTPFDIDGALYESSFTPTKTRRMYYNDKELLELDPDKKNFDTMALQRELSNRGYRLPKSTKQDGGFDGIFGDETRQTLINWQSKNKQKPLIEGL